MVETDAVVIGAGPVGLFQVFQLGLQDIRAHLIDALPHPGGQCAELYPDKPIYDIAGLPVCTGSELTKRLLQQIAPFATPMHLGQQVQSLQRQPDGRLLLSTTAGRQWLTRAVFLAAGVGAFVPRKVAVPGLDAFEAGPHPQVRYFGFDAATLSGQHAVVMGGEDAALETALQLLRSQRHVLLDLGQRPFVAIARQILIEGFEGCLLTPRFGQLAFQFAELALQHAKLLLRLPRQYTALFDLRIALGQPPRNFDLRIG